jgi:DeoR/GlpR family transcriptional regulator of sugar metabolism
MIITNNINVANRMRPYGQFEVVIAGGVVRHRMAALWARRRWISFASSRWITL